MGKHIIDKQEYFGIRFKPDTCNCDYIHDDNDEKTVVKVIHKCKAHSNVSDSSIGNEVVNHNLSWRDYFINNNITDLDTMTKAKAKDKERSERVPEIANNNAKKNSLLNEANNE